MITSKFSSGPHPARFESEALAKPKMTAELKEKLKQKRIKHNKPDMVIKYKNKKGGTSVSEPQGQDHHTARRHDRLYCSWCSRTT